MPKQSRTYGPEQKTHQKDKGFHERKGDFRGGNQKNDRKHARGT